MSAIAELADRLQSLHGLPDDAPELEAARQRLFDTVCCFAHGTTTDDAATLREVLDPGQPLLAPAAARLAFMCGVTRATEADDIHAPSCSTVGSVIVPVALLAGEAVGAAGRQVLEAIVAGYEAATRLGLGVDGGTRIYDGTWTTYLVAPFGAAATAAWLLRLEPEQIGQALAIAAERTVGISVEAGIGRGDRWFNLGRSAVDGWLSAIAASRAMIGEPAVLEHQFGRALASDFDAESFWHDAGTWQIGQVDTKPFRTNRQALACLEAFMDLAPEPAALARIECFVPKQYRQNVGRSGVPHDRWSPGLAYLLALAAYDRDALWDVHRAPVRDTPDVRALIDLTAIDVDGELTRPYPWHWGGRVRLTDRAGSVRERTVLDVSGSPARPFGWDELHAKHLRILRCSRPSRTGVRLEEGWFEQARQACERFDSAGPAQLAGLLAALAG
jgi:2-methylcitrate dehydratase PrpD